MSKKVVLTIVGVLILLATLGVGLFVANKLEEQSAKDTRPLQERLADVAPEGSLIDVKEKPETNSATVSVTFPQNLPESEIPAALKKLDEFKAEQLNRQKDSFAVVSKKGDYRVQLNTFGDTSTLSEQWFAYDKQKQNIEGKFAVASLSKKRISLSDNEKSQSSAELAEKLVSYSEHVVNSGMLSDFGEVTVGSGYVGDATSVKVTSPADLDQIRTYAEFVGNPNYPMNGPSVEIRESNLKAYGDQMTPEQRAYLESWPHGEVKFH
ncbi:hypothetical protein [Corynebacterium sp. H130]|uniref:hypothetical protein n=1 Tax=Corynebacterium sp. H130 TaxID=3133444 RepID=UPI00309EB311